MGHDPGRGRRWPSSLGTRDLAEVAISGASTLDAPRRVIDLATGLPSVTSLFSEMRPVIDDRRGSTILYVHLSSNQLIEERFGWEAQSAYLQLTTSYMSRVRSDIQRERVHCVVARAFADDYVVIFPYREADETIAGRIADGMTRHIQAIDVELASLHEVYVGSARAQPFSRVHPERLLYRTILSAQAEATDVGRQKLSGQGRKLDRCIARPELFKIVYQPLVRLQDDAIFAHEALARCQEPTFRSPHVLFNVAEQTDRIWPLSRLLRRLAVEPIADLPADTLMFLNLHPRDFDDPQLLQPETFIKEHAGRIVFEVTERAAVVDFDRFRRSMEVLRRCGARLAVDDLGSGYAALSSVAEMNPDFIKFDMTLIRDIHTSPIRQNLLRNMVGFALDTETEVVAEGVETREELDTLRALGCHYAQGYYLAHPQPPFVRSLSLARTGPALQTIAT